MIKKLAIATAVLLASSASAYAGGHGTTVCLITKTDTNPFFVKMREGASAKAKELGMITIGFTGEGGGAMKDCSDYLIEIPSKDTPRIQECHMLIGHSICEVVEKNLFPQ